MERMFVMTSVRIVSLSTKAKGERVDDLACELVCNNNWGFF
jgi:hypothetical protein